MTVTQVIFFNYFQVMLVNAFNKYAFFKRDNFIKQKNFHSEIIQPHVVVFKHFH